jgi:Protein of unknwon function (DUF3310)
VKDLLQEVLHAAAMIDLCQRVDRGEELEGHQARKYDLGPIIGELDWVTELHELLEKRKMNANDKQVGGAHYQNSRSNYQHWDLMVDNVGSGYLVGAATKYLARYRRKGTPVTDLKKALHFVEKLINLYSTGGKLEGQFIARKSANLELFAQSYLNEEEKQIFRLLLEFSSVRELQLAHDQINELLYVNENSNLKSENVLDLG